MNVARLTGTLAAAIETAYRVPGGSASDPNTFIVQLATAIATCVISEITTNARCNGVDSGGNTHNNVQIV